MNEHSYITKVHKKLDKKVYRWKVHDTLQMGVPDCWYSGSNSDLWVEYKYKPELPKRPTSIVQISLSEMQKHWLEARYKEGRNVVLAIGHKDRCLVKTRNFHKPITLQNFKDYSISFTEFLERLVSETCGDEHE